MSTKTQWLIVAGMSVFLFLTVLVGVPASECDGTDAAKVVLSCHKQYDNIKNVYGSLDDVISAYYIGAITDKEFVVQLEELVTENGLILSKIKNDLKTEIKPGTHTLATKNYLYNCVYVLVLTDNMLRKMITDASNKEQVIMDYESEKIDLTERVKNMIYAYEFVKGD